MLSSFKKIVICTVREKPYKDVYIINEHLKKTNSANYIQNLAHI